MIVGEVLEPVAEVGALPGGVLEQDHAAAARGRVAQQLRASPSAISRSPSSSVPVVYEPGCMTRPSQAERLGAIELLAERRDRLLAQRRRRGRDVDQVAVVRDDRLDAGLRDAAPEQRDLVVGGSDAGAPLPRRLGEDLQRLAAVTRPRDRPRAAVRRRSTDARRAAASVAEHLRLEPEDAGAVPPGVGRKARLDAGLTQELLGVQPHSVATCGSSRPRRSPVRRPGRGRRW